jgi:hypothetical protein
MYQQFYYFLVMANVRPREEAQHGYTTLEADGTYDLKGSTDGRKTPEYFPGIKKTILDQDYEEEMKNGRQMILSQSDKEDLMEQLEYDCDFLASQGLMDYSMLVGRFFVKCPVTENAHGELEKPYFLAGMVEIKVTPTLQRPRDDPHTCPRLRLPSPRMCLQRCCESTQLNWNSLCK